MPRYGQGDLFLVEALVQGKEGAWEEFVRRYIDLINSSCASVFSPAEAEKKSLAVLERFKADGLALLCGFDGRGRLETYLKFKIAEELADDLVKLLDTDADRAGHAFEGFFRPRIVRLIKERFHISSLGEGLEDGTTGEDLYQEIWKRLWEGGGKRLKGFAHRGSFAGYVSRVIEHLCEDLGRHLYGRPRLPEALRRLPALEQAVYKLVHLEGCPREELVRRVRQETGQDCTPEEIEAASVRVSGTVASRRRTAERAESPRRRAVRLDQPADEGRPRPHELPDPGPSPEAVLIHLEEQRAREELVRRAIGDLPFRERECVRLRFLDVPPKSSQEAAQALECSVEELYRVQERAMSKLRALLGPGRPGNPSRLSV